MIKPTRSVTSTIAKALVLILSLSVVTTAFAILTLASSLNDAGAVNVSGSMRMQSYRIAYDVQNNPLNLQKHMVSFESSLLSKEMQSLDAWNVPDDIRLQYQNIIEQWHVLKSILNSQHPENYLKMVSNYVKQIDEFVFNLQEFSEHKLIKLAWVGGCGLGGILLVSIFVVLFVRREVIKPLHALVFASQKIKNRDFDVHLKVENNNEMDILSRTFNVMAKDLGRMYRGLEAAVNKKTAKLQHANQSLQLLYDCSKELTVARLSTDNFQKILNHFILIKGITGAKLVITDNEGKALVLYSGEHQQSYLTKQDLMVDGDVLGYLSYHYDNFTPDPALIANFKQIIARAIFYNHAQRKEEQLLLFEERATIARELHDSLAQSLSYLKIQVVLSKRMLNKLPETPHQQQAMTYLVDIESGLSDAYTQLRELLTTFRLSLKEGTFGEALKEMLLQLGQQTQANIVLHNHLSSLDLDAHQQVHLLQLIREATINAIKHASASTIAIECDDNGSQVVVKIIDDGVGFEQYTEKLNHYGLNIMQERALRLNGTLTIESNKDSGCQVILKCDLHKEA